MLTRRLCQSSQEQLAKKDTNFADLHIFLIIGTIMLNIICNIDRSQGLKAYLLLFCFSSTNIPNAISVSSANQK